MPPILDGIRVIDLSTGIAGPGSSMYLADQGADVVRIETPKGPTSRSSSDDPALDTAGGFSVQNRGKRSLTLDLRSPDGKAVFHRLASRSDVLITNMRQTAAKKLEADYATLHVLNPRLIYGWVTAFGQKGPYATHGGYDRLTQGLSGAMYRKWENGTPVTAGVLLSDPSVPMLMAYGVMLALWQREKTGEGQMLETSLLQAAVAMQMTSLVKIERSNRSVNEYDMPTYGIYRCADGAYINVTALRPQQFERLCKLLELDDLAQDPRVFDPAQRDEFRREVYPVVEALFATKPSKEWLGLLDQADIPAAPILERDQVFSEPQMVENKMFVRVEHPRAGPVQMFAPPLNLSAAEAVVHRASPLTGEHSDEVLRELGYTDDEIAELRERNVI
jgi:formyl-CoA transferase